MLETILGRLGLPFLMSIVGSALGKIDNPVAQNAAKALSETQNAITTGAITTGAITPEARAEANRHIETMEGISQKERSEVLAQVNESLRFEVGSTDLYVRRMRPTFGYLMALTWTAQMLAIAYVIVFDTSRAAVVLQAVESLSTIWCIALSVLGLYVYKRSDEKRPVITVREPDVDQAPRPVPVRGSFND